MTDLALEGLKVLDFSWVAAGPKMTKYLADFGATVVRLESTKNACTIRVSAPFKDGVRGINRSTYFVGMNTNKYSMALDLKNPKAKEVVHKFAKWADLCVENFTAGKLERLGFGYEDLKKMKPDIIMLRTANQGQTGPHAAHQGFGYHLSGVTGLLHFTGEAGGDPLPLPVAYSDMIAPPFGLAALFAALEYRDRTGKGQMIDVSQLETTIQFLTPGILDYEVNHKETGRKGNLCDSAAPHDAYRCLGKDRWCAITVFTDEQWGAFCRVVGNPVLEEERFRTLLGRKQHEEELNLMVEAWTVNFTAEEVMKRLQEARVPAGVVQNGEDLSNDPQLHHRNYFWDLDHKEIGMYPHLGEPITLSETPPTGRMAAPCLGEHTDYVCREILGMEDYELEGLKMSGVFV
ncbi:MAG: CoA transferase [Desulfobacterium sp.]|nr:CoA transferase [Desulfobacteraceae bacterium]MBA3035668.1 CoA transferase [Desulfobacterium sp.]